MNKIALILFLCSACSAYQDRAYRYRQNNQPHPVHQGHYPYFAGIGPMIPNNYPRNQPPYDFRPWNINNQYDRYQMKKYSSPPNYSIRNFNQKPYVGNSRVKAPQLNLGTKKSTKKCGVLKPILRNYVANGKATSHTEWPWYVQIIIRTDAEAYCGGTLISENFILTAAHCFDDIPHSKMAMSTSVYLKGIRIMNQYTRQLDDVSISANEVYIHPEYIPAMTSAEAKRKGVEPGPRNDLALIRINIYNEEVLEQLVPACLPDNRYQLAIGTKCKIMGHGFVNARDEDNFVMPNLLQMADVHISENEICKAEVDSEAIKAKINDDTLCIRGPIHPCVGDSGGPLICKGVNPERIQGEDAGTFDYDVEDEEWYLTGVTSFAVSTDLNDKCGLFKSAVFGKVSNHLGWVKDITDL